MVKILFEIRVFTVVVRIINKYVILSYEIYIDIVCQNERRRANYEIYEIFFNCRVNDDGQFC